MLEMQLYPSLAVIFSGLTYPVHLNFPGSLPLSLCAGSKKVRYRLNNCLADVRYC